LKDVPNATETLNSLNLLVEAGFLTRGEIKVLEIKDQDDGKKMKFLRIAYDFGGWHRHILQRKNLNLTHIHVDYV